jgi:alkylhydroperoxidase family enzyme
MRYWMGISMLAGLTAVVVAAEPTQPLPVPVTRTEIKQTLENAKGTHARLPVPEPTEEEKAKGFIVNNGRMRSLLLPAELRDTGFSRDPDPNMSLSNKFKTELFWIVSRTNNCYYCLGHQEIKLTGAGMSDDEIAALDLNWEPFTPAERAAFAFTRKVTYQPHKLTDDDLAKLRNHYTDLQILEILLTVAGNNSINRWTGSLAIPPEKDGSGMLRYGGNDKATQGEYKTFLRPTSGPYKDAVSLVAPLGEVKPGQKTAHPVAAKRPPLEAAPEIEAALAACRNRTARLPLVAEDKARALLSEDGSKEPLPQWVRLLANFPKHGIRNVQGLQRGETKGNLSPKLKALVAWTTAREDRAWYALGHAKSRLLKAGLTEDAVYEAEGGKGLTDGEKLAVAFAAKLSARPFDVCDDDFTSLRKHYKDTEVAELIYHVGNAVFFNRLTEAAGLQLEQN